MLVYARPIPPNYTRASSALSQNTQDMLKLRSQQTSTTHAYTTPPSSSSKILRRLSSRRASHIPAHEIAPDVALAWVAGLVVHVPGASLRRAPYACLQGSHAAAPAARSRSRHFRLQPAKHMFPGALRSAEKTGSTKCMWQEWPPDVSWHTSRHGHRHRHETG